MDSDDPLQRYFAIGMRYLDEAGREFATVHPDRARTLDPDRMTERDPWVERLKEGFAFLAGRLQHTLDSERPELTEGLVSLLWPHYLHAMPSLSIVELVPSTLAQTTVVPPGLRLRATPVSVASRESSDVDGPTTVECRYRTTQAVTLQPLFVTHAGPAVRPDGRSVIRLGLEFGPSADRACLDLSRLRLYLNAERPTALAMHLALTRQIESIAWRVPDVRNGEAAALEGVTVRAAGFDRHDRLRPFAEDGFGGYELLLEYFAFKEQFLFVDLCGLDIAKLPAQATRFELELVLKHAYPADQPFTAENVRLFCTPVINLFELDAEPIVARHLDAEYRVVPSGDAGGYVETYSVDAVHAFDDHAGARHDYVPFATFGHRGGMLWSEAPERYFHARVRRGASGLRETWITLGGHAWDALDDLPQETLSLRLTCANGQLPRSALREAGIDRIEEGGPEIAGVRNLVAPTPMRYPPTSERFQWRALSHLAPSFLSLTDPQVLRSTLALYDWTDDELNGRRLAGILRVRQQPLEDVVMGSVERGVLIEVTLDAHAFTGDGDMMLFGEVLHQLFALYAEINQFTKLAIVSLPSQTRTEWPRSKARELS
ncbi:type VI secretion system baseplate subunit TssF [Burkholderia pseudomultivorans]|uniref:type VI secretion system baseplate subunit TssF n=1 Tax=Burkholderia pseudomultivorans TaxID=1207504 RepID=UPI0028766DA7|nr:type VI secretion system baseplate subunit TssF [Burkholderia pseudomultivorans]MDS0794249.1 type VI secretion system baseplate subunit TssF [Burkholderia pseudomultivorans]